MISGRAHLKKAYQDDRVAREYVGRRFATPLGSLLHRSQVNAVGSVIRGNDIRRAAEIAPGPGRLTVDTAPLLERITLLDASAQMLQEARKALQERGLTAKGHFVQSDAFALALLPPFDLVYSFRLIRHFERDDRLRLYREIATILSPRGWLVFDAVNEAASAPLRARAKPGEYEHFDALLRPDEVREELAECGFEVVSLTGVQRNFSALQWCQIFVAPRSDRLARVAMRAIDALGGEPLEWIVVCRRG
jgi:SAM-dependent methyltransferase